MAERKSVNKYYPPDWDPSKGSVNKYVGQHPLRDRAKKLSQGILVIRFELPYNIWCNGCGSHVGMGVRYNAEKSKTGNYYSTPIYKFRMKCYLCPNYFEIQTDPKNHDYVILEGARRKEQRWDPKENEQIVTEDKADQKKMATDAMFKLEHGSDDHKKGRATVMNLHQLADKRGEWKDDYVLNKIARSKFREEKKVMKTVEESDQALLSKSSLEIPLVAEKPEDVKLASLMKYSAVQSYDEKQKLKRKAIDERPLFHPNKRRRLMSEEKPREAADSLKSKLLSSFARPPPFDSEGIKAGNVVNPGLVRRSLGIKKKSVSLGSLHSESYEKTSTGVSKRRSISNGDLCERPVVAQTSEAVLEDRDRLGQNSNLNQTCVPTADISGGHCAENDKVRVAAENRTAAGTVTVESRTEASEPVPVIETDCDERICDGVESNHGGKETLDHSGSSPVVTNGILTDDLHAQSHNNVGEGHLKSNAACCHGDKKVSEVNTSIRETGQESVTPNTSLNLVSLYGDSDTDSSDNK